eukprot:2240760-Rhodomonas_salina.2
MSAEKFLGILTNSHDSEAWWFKFASAEDFLRYLWVPCTSLEFLEARLCSSELSCHSVASRFVHGVLLLVPAGACGQPASLRAFSISGDYE